MPQFSVLGVRIHNVARRQAIAMIEEIIDRRNDRAASHPGRYDLQRFAGTREDHRQHVRRPHQRGGRHHQLQQQFFLKLVRIKNKTLIKTSGIKGVSDLQLLPCAGFERRRGF